jgi:hypothetical protein
VIAQAWQAANDRARQRGWNEAGFRAAYCPRPLVTTISSSVTP